MPTSLAELQSTSFRTSRDADEKNTDLMRRLALRNRYEPARLAIARSLALQATPPALDEDDEDGKVIKGEHLFGTGGDLGAWIALLVEHASLEAVTKKEVQDLVHRHWHRGALLLADEYAKSEDFDRFVLQLAERAGLREGGELRHDAGFPSVDREPAAAKPVSVRLGEVGVELHSDEPVEVVINAPGVSPHIAFMGKTRSGKTRTGLWMAERIVATTNVPVLLIDPKGDFVRDGALVPNPDWGGATLASKIPGIRALDVPSTPIPLDFLTPPRGGSSSEIAELAIGFRDSFKKCVKTRGDVAMDSLRVAVDGLLRAAKTSVSLPLIRDEVARRNADDGKKKDSVEAKLNELTSLHLFEPTLAPADFFARRWVIGLNRAGDESKRLVMFLVLDALANFLLSGTNSATDSGGHRQLKHFLIVDEALEVLRYRHPALSKMVRQGAAKGGLVMLLSQSPEDFDQEEDDFLAQLGTLAIFTSSARSARGVSGAFGQRLRPERFSDKELAKGVALVKLPHRDAVKVAAWR
jgi:DNA sulfur modification protein DndE